MICSLTLVMVALICVIFISKICFKSYYNKQQIKQFATTYSNGIEIDKFSSILPPSSSSSCDAKAIEQKQMKCNVKKYSKSNEPINKFSIQTTTTLPKTEILTQKKQSLTTLKLPLTEINLHTLDYLNLQNNDNENNEKKLNLEEGIMLYETIVNECANKLQHSPSLLNEIINPETNQEVIQEDETVDLRGVQQRRQNRKNKRFKDSCCSVCLVDFKMKETVYRVKCCSSIFHTSCMQNWFQQSKSCPNCRKRF